MLPVHSHADVRIRCRQKHILRALKDLETIGFNPTPTTSVPRVGGTTIQPLLPTILTRHISNPARIRDSPVPIRNGTSAIVRRGGYHNDTPRENRSQTR